MALDGIFSGTGGVTQVTSGDFTTPVRTTPRPDDDDNENIDPNNNNNSGKRKNEAIKIRWAKVHDQAVPDAVKLTKRFNLFDVVSVVTGWNRLWGKGRPKAVARWLEKMACVGDTVGD